MARWIQPFDLEQTPLVRSGLIKWEDRYILMIDMHHIISDGVTMGLLAEDFMKAYEGETLVAEEIQYKEYASWEREQKVNGVWEEQKTYWKQEFAGELPVLELPLDGVRSQIENNEGDRIRFEIEEGIVTGLRETMSRLGGTLFMGLMAGYSILLSKYSGQEDIVIGTPIAGRRHAELEKVAGMFVNTLAFRSYPEGEKRIEDYLLEAKHKLVQAYENQEYPFEELVEELNVKRDLSRNPLFEVILVLQNTELKEMVLSDIQIKPYAKNQNKAKFDISLNIEEVGDQLVCEMEYRSRLFRRETIEQMRKHYIKILQEISTKTEHKLNDIDLLNEEETQQLLVAYNQTLADYPREKTVIDVIDEQVNEQPNATALVYKDSFLTYGEMNRRSNQLAHYLERKGVAKGDRVAIIATHSYELVIGILATLRAGAAYVPIDPKYPSERIEYMLQDSEAKVLYTNIEIEGLSYNQELITAHDKSIEKEDPTYASKATAEDVAYIIYTSGSTGRSKGVMIEHRGLLNYIWWARKTYLKDEKEVFALYSSITFDLTITSIFTPLLSGQVIAIYEDNGEEFILDKVLKDKKVSVIKVTPAHLTLIKDQPNQSSSVKRFIVGGENLPVKLAKEVLDSFGGEVEIYNEYGPTETVVGCMIYQYRPEYDHRYSVPIGRPADNVEIYLLDKNLQLVAPGIEGELYIAGEGVARGYLNKEELTKNAFIYLNNERFHNKRMYKTGDLAKMLPDGNIEYIRRVDNQVKLRGYRIELGEIECSIGQREGVRDVVVLNRKDGSGMDYLCAYVVKEETIAIEKIKEEISQELPHYMVPAAFVEIDAIPITANGKVNRARLLEMEVTYTRENAYEAATNELEEKLIAVWEGVLGVERIGVHDNFFELGGHSLKATIVSGRIQKEVEVEIGVRDVFQYPTIKELATKISKSHQKKYEKLVPLSKQESYQVSSAQRRLYIIQMMDKENVAYNMPFALTLTGQVERVKVEQAIQQLVVKHESLRTSFHIEGEEIVQKIADKGT
ncbi:non-ribosomal peptide synthetase, partial [Mesobacillus zeae]|uniref:non-ribosomal peptide synthetase n=1 Tax=Mesobacillus zeae TaxID=1917180 RepID=UPI001FEA1C85